MVTYIALGGEKRAILFGMSAFRRAFMEDGLTLKNLIDSLSDLNMSPVVDITYHALLNACAYLKAVPPDFTKDDVAYWLDEPGALDAVMTLFTESIQAIMPKTAEANEEEAKKKKK